LLLGREEFFVSLFGLRLVDDPESMHDTGEPQTCGQKEVEKGLKWLACDEDGDRGEEDAEDSEHWERLREEFAYTRPSVDAIDASIWRLWNRTGRVPGTMIQTLVVVDASPEEVRAALGAFMMMIPPRPVTREVAALLGEVLEARTDAALPRTSRPGLRERLG